MKIIDSIRPDKQFISLEFFPPKGQAEWPAFFHTVERLARLDPLFASVTYGAGGSTHGDSLEIVTRLQNEFGMETMAHLTCIGSTPDEIAVFLDALNRAGVHNVLALRGDLPQDPDADFVPSPHLQYAGDLVSLIRASDPGIGIGVAGYPEVHPEAPDPESDLGCLKQKLDNGADFVITQLFFDNQLYHDFVGRARVAGIAQPIIPGILPIVSLKVIKRIIGMCGASIPEDLMAKLEEADQRGGAAAVQEVGLEHARKQARQLLEAGAPGVHLYTLNRAEVILQLAEGLFK